MIGSVPSTAVRGELFGLKKFSFMFCGYSTHNLLQFFLLFFHERISASRCKCERQSRSLNPCSEVHFEILEYVAAVKLKLYADLTEHYRGKKLKGDLYRPIVLQPCDSALCTKAAPALSSPFQPYEYQSPQEVVTPFQILGGEAQIMLKAQERVTTRPVWYMSEGVQTEANEAAQNAGNVLWQWFFGEVDTITTYANSGTQDGYIGLEAPSLEILPIDLDVFGGEIICQIVRNLSSAIEVCVGRDSFLCSISDVAVSVSTQRGRPGMFGGEGSMMQKLFGRGLAFITAGGSIIQKNLARGEVIVVDAGCVVAITSDVELELKYGCPLKRVSLLNGSVLHAHLTGPGLVFVQSLPLVRLAQKIERAMTAHRI